MPYYMIQWSYSSESLAAMLKKPHDRSKAVKLLIEKFGGKLHAFYFCFGDYDGVAIVELPDNVTTAALSMAISSAGSVKAFKTTVLMPTNESVNAMGKGKKIATAYEPPGK